MQSEFLNLEPARQLLSRHAVNIEPYMINFKGVDLIIRPDVFNPNLTKVSGFLADNFVVTPGCTAVDMFTGSGALAILAAKRGAKSVTGIDISEPAVTCAKHNAILNNVADTVSFQHGNVWSCVPDNARYGLITANPPLLPVYPETLLEMAIADSPDMNLSVKFLKGCSSHMVDRSSVVYMAFSNACKVFFQDPLAFIESIALKSGLRIDNINEWNVGYEVYRIIKFMLN